MSLLRLPFSLLALIIQSTFLAVGQIWANKLRSILTTIGIVIGVASVTAVIASLTGLKKNVLTEFENLGTNKMFIYPFWNGRRHFTAKSWYLYGLHEHDFDGMLEHCPSIRAFTRETQFTFTIAHGSKSEDMVDVVGIEPSWHQVENRFVSIGRPFSLIDDQQARAVCLVNDKMRDRLGLPTDPSGESIMIGPRRYRVVGLLESRPESAMFRGGGSGSEVFVPFNTLKQSRNLNTYVVAISRSPDVAEEAQAEATFFLRHKRKIPVGEPADFRVEVVEQFLKEFSKVATTITLVATCVVGISLLVGGIGIMNIMLVSVSERTREIGLRKAVGARPSAILLQFLVEALVLCFLGGMIGLLGGQGITTALSQIKEAQLDKAYIPGWAIALAFGFAAAVGLIFGMFPAIKAARLDPIEALRHE